MIMSRFALRASAVLSGAASKESRLVEVLTAEREADRRREAAR
jgi:hypothetical protein